MFCGGGSWFGSHGYWRVMRNGHEEEEEEEAQTWL